MTVLGSLQPRPKPRFWSRSRQRRRKATRLAPPRPLQPRRAKARCTGQPLHRLLGAMTGVRWYILKFRFVDLTPAVMVAAIGHAIFSLSLGGTFMVVYGSYLDANESLARPAIWTAYESGSRTMPNG